MANAVAQAMNATDEETREEFTFVTLHPRRASLTGGLDPRSPGRPSRRFQNPYTGHSAGMGKLIRRSAIMTAAVAPIAALSLATSAVGTAQPLDCQNGYWWDPVANVCQPPVAPVPLNCAGGEYWNPVSNACRPLGQV
ncbi:hypothetical protein NGTWS1803_08720 [Mycolicibacterium cyprinidarum]|nr:hypothetical protein NGTWS1803_08720 [Mycolicibacterium sp. NGTWS1803]